MQTTEKKPLKLTEGQMRVLWMTTRHKGITKGDILSHDWRRLDRLHQLGLVDRLSQEGGSVYTINDTGRANLKTRKERA
jgi:hypothetical protein